MFRFEGKHRRLPCHWNSNNVKMEDCTFPVIHVPEHPLVVGLLHEHPVTPHTVGGAVLGSALHLCAGLITNKSEASAG